MEGLSHFSENEMYKIEAPSINYNLRYSFYVKCIKAAALLKEEFQCLINSFKIISVSSLFVTLAVCLIYEDPKTDNHSVQVSSISNEEYYQIIYDIGIRFLIPFFFIILLKYQGSNNILLWLGKFCYFLTFLFTTLYYTIMLMKSHAITYPTVALLIISFFTIAFAVLGIHPKSPKAFILVTIALISIVYTNFLKDSSVIFLLLGCAAIADGISVLCPWGSLNILFEFLRTRNENMPNEFVYQLNDEEVKYVVKNVSSHSSNNMQHTEIEITEKNLGCGDILFFSIFIGFVSLQNDWTITFACFFAILIGIGLTWTCLTIFNRETMPALPLPIFLGITVYFLMKEFASSFLNEFVMHQIVV